MPAKTIDAELFNARVPNGRRWLLWFLYKVLWRTVFGLVIGLRYVWSRAPHPDGPVIYIANHNSHLDAMSLMTIVPLAPHSPHAFGRRAGFLGAHVSGVGP